MKTRHADINNQHLVTEFNPFTTFARLRRSEAYRKHEAELSRLFNEPIVYEAVDARPRLAAFLRVVEWNIERGANLEGIIDVFNNHPILRYADLLLLNEVDYGMARSGNRNVALELARALSAHAAYGVEYLEFTKGVGDELMLAGENTAALHGNAILTRHRWSNAQLVRLPRCENNFESKEKRLGGRLAILIDLDVRGERLMAATAHLDVVNTPRCRAKQMRAALQAIDERAEDRAQKQEIQNQKGQKQKIIFGGDLNTHTFARGGRLRAIKNVARIFSTTDEKLARKLLRPETREPALIEFARFGYEIDSLNDGKATGRGLVSSDTFPEASRLPGPIRRWALERVGPEGLLLEFRLDWLAARNVKALKAGEVLDEQSNVESVDPQTLAGLTYNGAAMSDHDPIVVDLAISDSAF